ncbi:hypothetical protein [Erythrobacter rubeus]|uniref:Uncharacterized protein n=1 Tax=Erythrobacter rubeus TaxID=2760803 RepID=A0ABR8KSR5_9SPHN|nr:hypothetical protein [Erythrobacter rubeus]MBD2841474.1 hypothetical protein [Erythrobacter rubeus]
MLHTRVILAVAVLGSLSACNAPDPDDYGGGAKGAAVVKCISRTERADSSITREQAGEMCNCVTDKTMAALGGSGMSRSSMERALIGCATDAGIELTD